MVLACEVGGRWSDETRDFLRHLAKAKVRVEPFPVQRRAEAAWLLRWRVLLACSAAKAFALSLLEARSCVSSDGCAPLTGEVISDASSCACRRVGCSFLMGHGCVFSPHSVAKKKVCNHSCCEWNKSNEHALVNFVTAPATLFTDHRISSLPMRAKYKHFRTI